MPDTDTLTACPECARLRARLDQAIAAANATGEFARLMAAPSEVEATLRAERRHLCERLNALMREVARLRSLNETLCERVAAASAVLSKAAERDGLVLEVVALRDQLARLAAADRSTAEPEMEGRDGKW